MMGVGGPSGKSPKKATMCDQHGTPTSLCKDMPHGVPSNLPQRHQDTLYKRKFSANTTGVVSRTKGKFSK